MAATQKQGPNVRKLIAHKMSLIMIPPGTVNGLATGIAALKAPGNVVKVAREATEWVMTALAAVKAAPGSTYTDDEEIAGIILAEVEKRKAKR